MALLRERPLLLHDVLTTLGRRPLTAGLAPRDSALRITNPLEVRPDVVYLHGELRGPWAIVDVQRAKDDDKRRRWPAAAGVLLDTRGEMGDVVVITHDAAVARWADTIARVLGPGGTELWLRPIVLQLALAEVDALLAQGRAELAVVAAWAVHDQEGRRARAVVRAAVGAIQAALAQELEDLFMTPLPIPDSPVYTRIVERFEARGEARTLLRMLEKRGIAVDDAARARITGCTDIPQLDRWVDRAMTATSLHEVLSPSDGAE